MFFTIGDYIAGALIGSMTALAVRAAIWPGMDMVIGMLLGAGIGMVIQLLIGLLLSPLLGMFETMVPAALTGMYGGMLFGLRDSMAAGAASFGAAMTVGAILGLTVVAVVKIYDRVLRGTVIDMGE